MENRLSEKIIIMYLLEGIKHRTAGVNPNTHFNHNWKLPVNGDILSSVSLCSTSARTFGGKIGILFDIIFCHH